LFTVDNIFIDVAREISNNTFLLDNKIKPGSQNTATTPEMKGVAQKILSMKDQEWGSRLLTSTVGGCAVNTSRAANFYL